MKPEWRTDSTKPIDLSDVSAWNFEKYSQWLYTRNVPEDWINYVASLYVFGERVMDGLFQDAIISALIDHCTRTNKTVSLSLVRIIYQGTTSSSPARRLMVDVCAFDSGPKANKLQFLEVDKDGEFMLDLIVAMAKHRKPACGVSEYPWVKEPHSYLLGAAQELQAMVDKTQSGDSMDTTDV
jgi:hypothetical protein